MQSGRFRRPTIILIVLVAVVWRETRKPLRRRVESRLTHTSRNLAVGALAAAAVHLAETPVVRPIVAMTARRRWGLLPLCRLPAWLELVFAYALMDYTLYMWHVLVHKRPALWRFHGVHHADLDLDASTALRFHFGELIISVPWRIAQILMIGMTPRTFAVWQTATFASILFHHSNATLPPRFERVLSWFVVTPTMHGIHHSVVDSEMNSNWSSGLTLWDRLHGTLRRNVPQQDIVIGIQDYRSSEEVSLLRMLALPFADSKARPTQSDRERDDRDGPTPDDKGDEAPETPPTEPPPQPIKEPPADDQQPYVVTPPSIGRIKTG